MRIDYRSTNVVMAGALASLVLAASLSAGGWTDASQGIALTRVVDDAALADEASGNDWLAYGRTYREQRFSPLTQVNDTTVSRLAPDWVLELPSDRGLVSTPLVVDGVMYFIGGMNVVRAVNATSGALLWEFDPELRAMAGQMRAGWDHNRGIGFWKGKVYLATWDGRLIALDARTGKELWRVRTFEAGQPLYITGAPKIFKGKVLIGNGGTENGKIIYCNVHIY